MLLKITWSDLGRSTLLISFDILHAVVLLIVTPWLKGGSSESGCTFLKRSTYEVFGSVKIPEGGEGSGRYIHGLG
jgi:hypothetical protein